MSCSASDVWRWWVRDALHWPSRCGRVSNEPLRLSGRLGRVVAGMERIPFAVFSGYRWKTLPRVFWNARLLRGGRFGPRGPRMLVKGVLH